MAPNRRRRRIIAAVLVVMAAAGAGWWLLSPIGPLARNLTRDTKLAAAAPHPWARHLDRPGLPNLYEVSPGLYRGAQPTREGFRQLKQMGVRTVICLRQWHSDRDKLDHTHLAYEPIPSNAWHAEEQDVVRFLRIMGDPARRPVFVHCKEGSDRTGLMCAVYRVVFQGWTKDQALAEMTHGGFGFHKVFDNLEEYVRNMDVEKLKKEAGINGRE